MMKHKRDRAPKRHRKNGRHNSVDNRCWDWYNSGKCQREGCRWMHDNLPHKSHYVKYTTLVEKIRKNFKKQWTETKMRSFEIALSKDLSLADINLQLAKDFDKAEELDNQALTSELLRVVLEIQQKKTKIWFEYEKPLYKCLKKICDCPEALQNSEVTDQLGALLLIIDFERFPQDQACKMSDWKSELSKNQNTMTMSPIHKPLQEPHATAIPEQGRDSDDSGPCTPPSSADDMDTGHHAVFPTRKKSFQDPTDVEEEEGDGDSDHSLLETAADVVNELELLQKELSEHCDQEKIGVCLRNDHVDQWVRNFQRIIDRFLTLPTQQIGNLPQEDLAAQVEKLETVTFELCEILEQVNQEPQLELAMEYSTKLLRFLKSLDIDSVSSTIADFQSQQVSRQNEITEDALVPEIDEETLEQMGDEVEMEVESESKWKRRIEGEKPLDPALLKLMRNTAYKLLRAFPGRGVLADLVKSAICKACGIQKTYQQIEDALLGYIQSDMSSGRHMVSLHKSIINKMYLDWEQTHLLGFDDKETVLMCEFPCNPRCAAKEQAALRSVFVRLLGVEKVVSGLITKNAKNFKMVVQTKSREVAHNIENAIRNYTYNGEKVTLLWPKNLKESIEFLDLDKESMTGVRVHPSAKYIEHLSNDIEAHYRALCPSKANKSKREQLQKALQPILERVAKKLDTGAYFEVFGSTANGLDTINSDLDLSIHLLGKDKKEARHIDSSTARNFLRKMAREMKRQNYRDVTPVLFARVPIVKFKDKDSDIESDISIRNSLSKFKTRLLKMFIRADRRVKPLILAVKHWSKSRDIGDAARGSLNMFGYTLLVIQFLQCLKPPILPVVKCSANWDENNDWMNDPSCHERFGAANKMQLGELLISFFEFYRRFNFERGAISVRTGKPIPVEQCYCQPGHKRVMIIEDPFDSSDNCARNITESMLSTVRQEFVRAYAVLTGGKCSVQDLCVPKSKNNVLQPQVVHSPKPQPVRHKKKQRSPHPHAYSPSTLGVFHQQDPDPPHLHGDPYLKHRGAGSMVDRRFVAYRAEAPGARYQAPAAALPKVPHGMHRGDAHMRLPANLHAPPSALHHPRQRPDSSYDRDRPSKSRRKNKKNCVGPETIFNVLESAPIPVFPSNVLESSDRENAYDASKPVCQFIFPFLKPGTTAATAATMAIQIAGPMAKGRSIS